MEMPDRAIEMAAESKRDLLDAALQRIMNLATEVDIHATTLERVLVGGAVTDTGASAPEPEGYIDMTLTGYASIERLLTAADARLVSLDKAFHARPQLTEASR